MGKGKLKEELKNQKATDKVEAKKEKKERKEKTEKKMAKPVKPVLQEPDSEDDSLSLGSEEDQANVGDLVDKDTPLLRKEKRKLKKMIAQAQKANPDSKGQVNDSEESDDEEDDDEEDGELDLEKLAASESESDLNSDDDEDDEDEENEDEEDEDEEDEEDQEEIAQEEAEEEDIPLLDAELDSDADVVPHSKLTINNVAAMKQALARIALPWDKHPFTEHQSIISAANAEAGIKDIYDDTERELAFYRQGLDAVRQGRATLLKLKVPFSRPLDYFAEMVKTDEHMDKLRTKLLKEAADKKASEDAKKQRQLKKFGKKVQHETLQERAKQKKDTLEKIKSLKKKRGANEMSNDTDFQIALEEAAAEDSRPKRAKPNGKRIAKDSKYGHGGQKRGMRRNDAESAADIYDQRGKKGKPSKSSRPGKSKRGRK